MRFPAAELLSEAHQLKELCATPDCGKIMKSGGLCEKCGANIRGNKKLQDPTHTRTYR